MDVTSEQVCLPTRNPGQPSVTSNSRSGSATERCRQELDDYDVDFGVRPPSGTNHQQPGKYLSIDTRFSELSLEDSSLIAESERDHSSRHGYGVVNGSISRNKIKSNRVQVPKGNFYVTSPFKQGPEKDAKGPLMVVDPSHELKQRTMAGITKVKKQLENEKNARHFKLHHSQLQRGNLRPLGRPVTASGPAMSQCKGIVAGSRSYHGFARRRTTSSLSDGKCQRSNSTYNAMFGLARPDSPHEKLRPESSFHNTSCASSVDPTNDDSDGTFSEDDNEDSVDVEFQIHDVTQDNKDDQYDESCRHYSSGNGRPTVINTCKPYGDPTNGNWPHPDDDSDKEKGQWARQADQFVSCHSVKSCGNANNKEQKKKSGNGSSSQGKQTSFRTRENEEKRRSGYDMIIAKNLEDCLNTSSSTKSNQKIRNSTRRERGPLESRKSEHCKITKPVGGCSRVGDHKIIDVHIVVPERHWRTTEGQHWTNGQELATTVGKSGKTVEGLCVATEELHAIKQDQYAKTEGRHVNTEGNGSTSKRGQNTTADIRKESLTRFGENDRNLFHDAGKIVAAKDEDSDELADSEALDTDRIPSAEIFRVLDNLNLNTSAMKPPAAGGKYRSRKIHSAGHARTKHEAPIIKREMRPASSKEAYRKENQNGSNSSKSNISTLEFGRAEGLMKDAREKIPGYFTKEYQKILEKKNASAGEQIGEVGLSAASSDSLSMVHMARDATEDSSDLSYVENGVKNFKVSLITDRKEDHYFTEMQNSESTGSNKTEVLGQDHENCSEGMNSSGNSSSGVFVTMDSNSELRGVHDVEDSRSDVGSISCITNCSSFERCCDCGSNSSQSTPLDYRTDFGDKCENDRDFAGVVNDGGVFGGDGSMCDDNPSQSSDNFDDDTSSLEVVAKVKPLSESRFLKQKKRMAPFPPVCFSVNARPPEGHLYYFAYGPDMNPHRMAIYLRREPKTRLWGILFGFQLRFNKRGTSAEAGGFPNIQFNPEHSVEGCVYAITDTELVMLDNCVGYPKHYTRAVFPVWMLNSTNPSRHGVAQFCVPAVLYVAQNEWVTNDYSQKLDCSYCVSQCVKASDILTPNYVEFLSSQAAS